VIFGRLIVVVEGVSDISSSGYEPADKNTRSIRGPVKSGGWEKAAGEKPQDSPPCTGEAGEEHGR